ncbi:MAG TPA: ribonuclease H-like domain-containing protein [Anaerolineaceae bacterium]|nr:ribonuclease H-like domain-containing protein [Anaerolineaceae bacterium]
MSDWQNLSEQLRKLGVKLGVQEQEKAKPPQTDKFPIESVLNCSETRTPAGNIISIHKQFPLSYTHGAHNITPSDSFKRILTWANIPEQKNIKLENLIFLDTETTGLSGGTGTMVFMVGLAKFTGTDLLLEQFFLRNPSEEEAFLHAISQFCADMKAVVSYNGKAFDIPILNTRHILQRIPSPFINIHHIDLLTVSRQLWRLRLSQCRLANIEQEILQYYRQDGEVPGYLVPEFYKDYLQTGDARPLKGVFYHNQEDVLSLTALFSLIADILEDPFNANLPYPVDVYSLGKIFEQLHEPEIANKLYKHSQHHEQDTSLRLRYILQQASLLKQQKMFHLAIPLWEEAASLNNLLAIEELAKYHEHKSKQLHLALELCQKALSYFETERNTETDSYRLFKHRQLRLIRKINREKNKN